MSKNNGTMVGLLLNCCAADSAATSSVGKYNTVFRGKLSHFTGCLLGLPYTVCIRASGGFKAKGLVGHRSRGPPEGSTQTSAKREDRGACIVFTDYTVFWNDATWYTRLFNFSIGACSTGTKDSTVTVTFVYRRLGCIQCQCPLLWICSGLL